MPLPLYQNIKIFNEAIAFRSLAHSPQKEKGVGILTHFNTSAKDDYLAYVMFDAREKRV